MYYVLLFLSISLHALELPSLHGSHKVGMKIITISDVSRPEPHNPTQKRTLLLHILYPAEQCKKATLSTYMPWNIFQQNLHYLIKQCIRIQHTRNYRELLYEKNTHNDKHMLKLFDI